MTPKTPAPLAYSYIRISTDAQTQGDGLRRQAELSRTYAHEHGLRLVEDFKLEDRGVSAFKGDNATTGALRRFLDAVQAGKVPKGSFLLVESLDRLSRDKITTALRLFLDITEAGVSIVTLADGQVYHAGESDFPQLVYSMAIMSRANDESRMKSLRLSAAWRNKRDRADAEKLTKVAPAWLRLSDDRKSFELIPDRAQIVRRIFRMSTDGIGTYSIVQLLNRDGVPPFGRSNGWNESYIEKIVKNRAVLGEYQPHHLVDSKRHPLGDPIKNYYPAVVTEDQFYAAQAARRARATYKGGRKGTEFKNLFTHIATCAYCGAPMRMVDKGKGPKGGRYLRCSAGLRGMGCTTKGWRYEDFERSFLFLAREVDLGGIIHAEAADKLDADRQQRLIVIGEKLTGLQLQRDRLAELLADPNVGVEFVRQRLATANAEIEELTAEAAEIRRQSAGSLSPAVALDDLRALITHHGSLRGAAAYDHRSLLAARLRSVVKSLTVATEGHRPTLGKTRALLEDGVADPAFAAAVMQRIEEVSATMQRFNPSFQVTFVGGTTRQATVSATDPMEFVVEALVKPEVGAKVDLSGSTAFAVARR